MRKSISVHVVFVIRDYIFHTQVKSRGKRITPYIKLRTVHFERLEPLSRTQQQHQPLKFKLANMVKKTSE